MEISVKLITKPFHALSTKIWQIKDCVGQASAWAAQRTAVTIGTIAKLVQKSENGLSKFAFHKIIEKIMQRESLCIGFIHSLWYQLGLNSSIF